MNFRSIHFRLILWYGGVTVAMALLFGIYIYESFRERIYDELLHVLTFRAQNIANHILPDIQEQTLEQVAEEIEEVFSPRASNRFIRILRQNRSVLYVSGPPKNRHFDPQDIRPPPIPPPPSRIVSLSPGYGMLIAAVKGKVQGRTYYVEMGAETDAIEAELESLLVSLLFGLPLLALGVSAGGSLLIRRALRPVEDIRQTAQKITFTNVSSRLPVPNTGDSLEHLSITLNQMLNRLDEAYQQASRFSADASHELRTPLTIMRGELESILRDKKLPEDLRERLESVLEEAERLSNITASLFAISRLDAGEAMSEGTRFDLAALAESTAEQMALLAQDKDIRLEISASSPVWTYGDRGRIKEVVVNLLDNAIKYTPRGGEVSLRVSAVPDAALMEVSDTGIGIPPEALPHVFERFYRVDKARSRELGGAGLGLSIVRSICHAHGGNVSIDSIPGKGTTCRVRLPTVGAPQQRPLITPQTATG